jgi:hypothetical protein
MALQVPALGTCFFGLNANQEHSLFEVQKCEVSPWVIASLVSMRTKKDIACLEAQKCEAVSLGLDESPSWRAHNFECPHLTLAASLEKSHQKYPTQPP